MIHAAGLLIFRKHQGYYQVMLAHPGGPFWAKKDDWSIPKGEVDEGETLLQTMEREFIEETGFEPPLDNLIDLGSSKVSGGKTNYIWAAEKNIDLHDFHCDSMATMVWPPRSGMMVTFPENDKVAWFSLGEAYHKIFRSQTIFIERLAEYLGIEIDEYAI